MGMSDTTMSGPNDWLHFYDQQNSFPPHASSALLLPSSVSDATTVTVTTTSPLGNGTPAQLSPEGRVSKPIRRRSRASKRTPTTLLNTDTTNFRAMVQQFTGAPFAPTPSSSAASGFPTLGFGLGLGLGSGAAHVNPNGLMIAPSSAFQQQQHYYMYSSGGNTYTNEVGQSQRAASSDEGVFMGHGGGGRFSTPNTTSS